MGNKIKQFRLNKKWSISELSKRSGVSVGLISMLENNKVNVSIKKLQALTEALEIELKDIL